MSYAQIRDHPLYFTDDQKALSKYVRRLRVDTAMDKADLIMIIGSYAQRPRAIANPRSSLRFTPAELEVNIHRYTSYASSRSAPFKSRRTRGHSPLTPWALWSVSVSVWTATLIGAELISVTCARTCQRGASGIRPAGAVFRVAPGAHPNVRPRQVGLRVR